MAKPVEGKEKPKMVTFKIDPQLQRELKGASFISRQTLTDIVERAIEKELTVMRTLHNGGKPFPLAPE